MRYLFIIGLVSIAAALAWAITLHASGYTAEAVVFVEHFGAALVSAIVLGVFVGVFKWLAENSK